jgi:hypothetical protein
MRAVHNRLLALTAFIVFIGFMNLPTALALPNTSR